MPVKTWSFGDRVVHGLRPEWGVGTVTSAQPDVQEGKTCQRLTIRFERAGLKTLSTAHAELRGEHEGGPAVAAQGPSGDDPFAAAVERDAKTVMTRLPDAATDPFTTPRARAKATMDLYRFSAEGGSLIDWAAMQSGLKDPMTRFNRHELEELFRRFAQVRDDHLKRLALDLKRTDPGLLGEVVRTAPRGAQQVLKRLDLAR